MSVFVFIVLAAIPAHRYADDLRAGAELFEAGTTDGQALAYAAAVSPVDVELADGRVISVRDPWLEEAAGRYAATSDETEPGRKKRDELGEEITTHLRDRATRVHIQNPEGGGPPSPPPGSTVASLSDIPPEAASETLSDVLAGDDFQHEENPPALVEAAFRVRTWFRNRWEDIRNFFKRLFGGESETSTWEIVRQGLTLLAALVAVAVILIWVVRAIGANVSADATSLPPPPEMPEQPPQPAAMAAEARTLREAGDLRGAVRALYLALLGALHASGKIRYDRHRTNREYIRDLKGRPEAQPFTAAVELFDRKWYGNEDVSEGDVETMQRLYADLTPRPGEEAA